jgi:hypothetical protein
MAKSKTDLSRKIEGIVQHTSPLPAESTRPILHFERTAASSIDLLKYVDDHLTASGASRTLYGEHMAQLRRMALVSLIEAFERFLKELAAVCIDALVGHVGDDRFEEFSAKGGQLAFHLSAGSVGKALCESDTWLTNRTINDRFKRLLKSPFGDNWENLFPEENQQPQNERARARTLAILWQIRHTITHNVGVITGSDAAKFRMLVKGMANPDRVLRITKSDIVYTKKFLFESSQWVNDRVGKRLETLLDVLHRENPALFDAQQMADRVSRQLGFSITVNNSVGVP